METYMKVGAAILLLIIALVIICAIILPLLEDNANLKDRKKEAIKYINGCLTTNRKLDLDAVLITIKGILETTEEFNKEVEEFDKKVKEKKNG